ncbi:MAG TPA: glycosyltransferase [Methylomirabilota bacterium]|nr:glycosyltransferase [Methylomirabilota bacterium]
MKVALVHDWLTGMRGGERVLERVARNFPGADLFTLVWHRGSVSDELERHRIHTSFLDRLPAADTHYRWFLPMFPLAIESLDLAGYDAVVSVSHAVAKGVRTRPGAPHVSLVLTPMRYVWDLEQQYFPPGRFPWPLGAYVRQVCADLRRWDRATANRPTHLVSISNHVAERVRRHWGRESQVVYPHVDVERFSPWRGERPYYLLAGAFAPYKRLDLALAAFARLQRPLLVVGGGQEEARLHAVAPRGTEFRSGVSDEELARLIARARAFIFPGEEDFGIMPLEAMASGTPVIAYGRGGAVETVGRGATVEALEKVAAGGHARVPGGMLFGTQTADAIAAAVSAFERETFEPTVLAALAGPFSGERFDAEIRAVFRATGITVDERT